MGGGGGSGVAKKRHTMLAVSSLRLCHGLYRMYICVMGCTECTSVSWVVQNVHLCHGLYRMYVCVMGCTKRTSVPWAV